MSNIRQYFPDEKGRIVVSLWSHRNVANKRLPAIHGGEFVNLLKKEKVANDSMIQQLPEVYKFKQQLRDSLVKESLNSPSLTITKNSNIYNCGDNGGMIYFIETGQVELGMLSSQGKKCKLSTCRDGDMFGELCLSPLDARKETATAREDTVLKQIPSNKFFLRLQIDQLLEGFIRYLAVQIDDQQEVIANLVAVDNEQRLGHALLQLANPLGMKNADKLDSQINISYEELSKLVGIIEPRISLLIQRFRHLGLIEISPESFFIIKEKKLANYLAQITS